MATLRLANGGDVTVKLSIAEIKTALGSGGEGFIEMPGEDGPIHVRSAAVIAVLEDAPRGRAGFRVESGT